VTCPSLSSSTPLTVSVSTLTQGSTATYACDSGYNLVGDTKRTCQLDGAWSSSEPTCQIVSCSALLPTSPLSVTETALTFGGVALYTCSTGHEIIGADTRTCQADGNWSGLEPSCQIVSCPPLSATYPLTVIAPFLTYGEIATYTCESGYDLIGIGQRTCQSDKSWSGSQPSCSIITCPPPSPPTNGQVELLGPDTSIGQQINYTCDKGYTLNGTNIQECQLNKTWSGNIPVCEIVSCLSLIVPNNGHVEYPNGIAYGAEAVFTCSPGFYLDDNSTALCTSTGTWSIGSPTCKRLSCGPAPSVQNGTALLLNGTTLYGDIAQITCNTGFTVSPNILECLANQTWGGAHTTCQPVPCSKLNKPENGTVAVTSNPVYEDIAMFECDSSFELLGEANLTCNASGQWDHNTPVCEMSGTRIMLHFAQIPY